MVKYSRARWSFPRKILSSRTPRETRNILEPRSQWKLYRCRIRETLGMFCMLKEPLAHIENSTTKVCVRQTAVGRRVSSSKPPSVSSRSTRRLESAALLDYWIKWEEERNIQRGIESSGYLEFVANERSYVPVDPIKSIIYLKSILNITYIRRNITKNVFFNRLKQKYLLF